MSANRSEAMRRRWADPAYRARQTAANRRTAEAQRARLADPRVRKRLGLAIRRSWAQRKERRR